MSTSVPTPALTLTDGSAPVLLVAPHIPLPATSAHPFLVGDPVAREQVDAHVSLWHDVGTDTALRSAGERLRAPTAAPPVPRGLVDLNRGWAGRAEAEDTLFGKGALDQSSAAHLAPGAAGALQRWYHEAMTLLADRSEALRGFVEIHSFGDLGSTYQKRAGGRPVRRPEAAVITTTPWATAFPVGLARLLPADLRGTPWALEREVGDALTRHGLGIGPSPYPTTGPWALSARFLAARWLRWLGERDLLPSPTVQRLVHLAWHDEQDAELDAVATGQVPEPAHLEGVAALADRLAHWSAEGPALGDAFLGEDDGFSLVVELRNDRVDRAAAFGEAVAEAVERYLDAR